MRARGAPPAMAAVSSAAAATSVQELCCVFALHAMQPWPSGHAQLTSRSVSRTCSGLHEPPASQCLLAAWLPQPLRSPLRAAWHTAAADAARPGAGAAGRRRRRAARRSLVDEKIAVKDAGSDLRQIAATLLETEQAVEARAGA